MASTQTDKKSQNKTSSRSIISSRKEIVEGKEVIIKTVKPRGKQKFKNTSREITTTCHNCSSLLKLNEDKQWECTGSILITWELQFEKYSKLDLEARARYLENISNYSGFIELYDRWVATRENGEKFNCGYSGAIYNPNGHTTISIPDPIFVKLAEKELGRKLTEEELYEGGPLLKLNKKYIDIFEAGAIEVLVPFITLPAESTFYPNED